ncbi:MAG TPA: hypothetical protein VGH77_17180 [Streptosporangiaceae bacterium]|jgi:hypothetical protein
MTGMITSGMGTTRCSARDLGGPKANPPGTSDSCRTTRKVPASRRRRTAAPLARRQRPQLCLERPPGAHARAYA